MFARKLNKNRSLTLILFVGIALIQISAVYKFLFVDVVRMDDGHRLSHFFVYNLKSFIDFSEFAWWFPYPENGYPGYFTTMTGATHLFFSPFSLIYTMMLKLLSFVSIKAAPYTAYVWYQLFFVPLLIAWPMYMISRLIFKNIISSFFVVLLFCFGSSFITNNITGGYSFLPNMLSFWYIYFLIRYDKFPTVQNLKLIFFSLAFILANISWTFMHAAFFYLPVFTICVLADKALLRQTLQNLLNFNKGALVFLIILMAAGIMVSFAPVIAGSHYIGRYGGQFVESAISSSAAYPIEMIVPAYPQFLPQLFVPGVKYGEYLGVLALPAILLSLSQWRNKTYYSFLITFLIVGVSLTFGNKNPFYVFLYEHISFLRLNRYITSTCYSTGGLYFLMFVAVFGLDVFISNVKSISVRKLAGLLSVCAVVTMILSGIFFKDYFYIATVVTIISYLILCLLYLLFRKYYSNRKFLILLGSLLLFLIVADLFVTPDKIGLLAELSQPSTMTTSREYREDLLKNPEMTFNNLNILGQYNGYSHRGDNYLSSRYYVLGSRKYGALLISNIKRLIITKDFREGDDPQSVSIDLTAFIAAEKSGIDKIPEGVTVKDFSFNRLSLEVNSKDDQMLIYRDTYDPYWTAFIDGIETDIFKVNDGIMKGIKIPKGEHHVKFIYNPKRVRYSLYTFYVLAVSGFIFFLIGSIWRRRRPDAA